MNKNAVRVVSSSTVRVSAGEDSVQPEASDAFVSSPYVEQVTQRALAYLVAGYPVHFSGVAGTGKTTLAFHVAYMETMNSALPISWARTPVTEKTKLSTIISTRS